MDVEFKNQFVYKLRNGKINTPTKVNFNLQEWENYQHTLNSNDLELQMIIQSGVFIFKQLEDIRKCVNLIENEIKDLSRAQFIQTVVALSNFMRSTIHMPPFDLSTKVLNMNDLIYRKLESDIYQNQPTLMDVAVGCIDGVQKIMSTKVGFEITSPRILDENIFQEIFTLLNYSLLYEQYEKLWHGVMYGFLTFEIDVDNKSYNFKIKDINQTKGFQKSQNRRFKLAQETFMHMIELKDKLNFIQDKYFLVTNSKNKEIQFIKIKSSNAPEHLQIFNLTFIDRALELDDLIPQEILKRKNIDHFNIIDVLEIFRYLALLSLDIQDQRNINATQKNGFGWVRLLAPIINKTNLIKSLANITKKPYGLILAIINFLIFNTKKDLWCHPILELQKNKITLLYIMPLLFRTIKFSI